MPNGPAQERVIGEALSQAGVQPSQVDYLEAHGAGSELGDPIEVQAAAAVYGKERDRDRPLLIGSVKTNIGHLESAAGVASLIKVVLAMRHGVIPKHLHFQDPNPHLDWDQLPVRVVSEATDWPRSPDRPPLAGISAFGISGTNAHVVVEGHGSPNKTSPDPDGVPRPVPVPRPDAVEALPQAGDADGELAPRGTRLLPLSGKSGAALRKLAQRYLEWLSERESLLESEGAASGSALSDMAWTAGVGRSHFDHRAALVFEDSGSLRRRLRALAEADERSQSGAPTKVAFVCTGRGSGWAGTIETLYASEPVVRAVLDRCDAVFGEVRSASLLDVMFGRPGAAGSLDDPQWGRPAIYALESALTALWSGVGVRPSIALGFGSGALTAAQAAGVIGLEDGLRLAAAPGDPRAVLDGVAMAAPDLILIDMLSGRALEPGEVPGEAYWRRHPENEPPAPDRCVEMIAAAGADVVVEIGPDAALATMLSSAWPETSGKGSAPVLLSTLGQSPDREAKPASRSTGSFVDAVSGAYEAGLPVSFTGLFAGEGRRRISLPDYPFERRRHWI